METKAKASRGGARFNVTANLLESESAERLPRSVAYIFSANGRLLGQEIIGEKGAELTVAASEGSKVHVLVGPEVKERVTLAELRRRGAAEQALRVGRELHNVDLQVVPNKWQHWLLGLCFVHGNLFKRIHFGPFHFTLCVPNATVEIYEVDPLPRLILELPDDLIERIRDYIIRPFPVPPPPPEEIIGPIGPLPDPEMEINFNMAHARAAQSFARASAALPEARAYVRATAADAQTAPQMSAQSLQRSPVNSISDLQFLATRTSTLHFRQALLLNPELIRPIFCILFPINVTMQLVATAVTNEDGYFSTFFFRGINNPDQPDLYFRAKQHTLWGPNTVIYAPTPIPCYTYWNYQCGTEVSLYTSHPAAIGRICDPTADGITVDRIGDFPLSRIRGTSVNLAAGTNTGNIGLTDSGSPWGGVLRLRLEFDRDLPTNAVKYYRVQWRKGTSGAFTDLSGNVDWTAMRNAADGTPIYSVYNIGPKIAPNGTPNLYEIHSRGNLAPDGVSFWSPQDLGGVIANNTNAIFDSMTLAGSVNPDQPDKAGIYQLKIDLFNNNGNQVTNLTAAGVRFFVPPSVAGDITGDDADHPLLDLVQGSSFIMSLHIDNNPPVVDVQAPTLNSESAGECGALEYDPDAPGTVQVPFIAGQRNGFATFTYKVRKGGTDIFNTPSVGVGVNSHVLLRTQMHTVTSLLGDCAVVGLLAQATVSPLAITGWGPVYNDVSDNFAFALAPEMEEA